METRKPMRKHRRGERVGVFWATVESSGMGISGLSNTPYLWIRARCLKRYDPKLGDSACDFYCRGFIRLSSKESIAFALRTLKEVFGLDLNYQQLEMLDDPWALKGKPFEATIEQYLTTAGGRNEQIVFFNSVGHFSARLTSRLPKSKRELVMRKIHDIEAAPDTSGTVEEGWNDM